MLDHLIKLVVLLALVVLCHFAYLGLTGYVLERSVDTVDIHYYMWDCKVNQGKSRSIIIVDLNTYRVEAVCTDKGRVIHNVPLRGGL